MENNFCNTPSVGSHDTCVSVDAMNARICNLEARADAEEKSRRAEREPEQTKKPRFRWKKVWKFITRVFVPVLRAVSTFLNALASYKAVAV